MRSPVYALVLALGAACNSESLADAGSEDDSRTTGPGELGDASARADATTPVVDATVAAGDASTLEHFSFFVTSLRAMQKLSGADVGFGGDLRFGELGAGAGLRGADKICSTIAEQSMPGASAKRWRAFLSAVNGADGGLPVHAIERIGEGPWYDRKGRLVAADKNALLSDRPMGADTQIIDDLPNELGVPNHNPDGQGERDNHDTLTGSDATGRLYTVTPGATCEDWTSALGKSGTPRVGHSWIRNVLGTGSSGLSGRNWISSLDVAGCAPGNVQDELGVLVPDIDSVGSASGYGGIYCFALTP